MAPAPGAPKPIASAKASASTAGWASRRIRVNFATSHMSAIIGSRRFLREVRPVTTALKWRHLPTDVSIFPTGAAEVLDSRHDDLRAGLQIIKGRIRVVLLQQPHRQVTEAMRQAPERIPGSHHVYLGARNAVRGKVRRLQLAVIVAPL